MYNLLKSSLNEHTQSVRGNMRVKVEEYATKIARVEGEHTLEVMLELNFNRSLLSVAGKPVSKGYAYILKAIKNATGTSVIFHINNSLIHFVFVLTSVPNVGERFTKT